MKPRTVYEKAVQDFIETARQLARLNQHFRQASFAEFEMLTASTSSIAATNALLAVGGMTQCWRRWG